MTWKQREQKKGWFWHIHHGAMLVETTDPYEEGIRERIDFIKNSKEPKEEKTRLFRLRRVKNQALVTRLYKVICNDDTPRPKKEELGIGKYDMDDMNGMDDSKKEKAAADLLALHKKECPRCFWKINHPSIFKTLNAKW